MLTTKYLFIALLCVGNAKMYIYIIKIPLHFVRAKFRQTRHIRWEPDRVALTELFVLSCDESPQQQLFRRCTQNRQAIGTGEGNTKQAD